MTSTSVLSQSPPGILSLSVSQPSHTCSTPTLAYLVGISYPWYTSPGWVGIALAYATVNIKFLIALCSSQGVRRVISSTGYRCWAIISIAGIPVSAGRPVEAQLLFCRDRFAMTLGFGGAACDCCCWLIAKATWRLTSSAILASCERCCSSSLRKCSRSLFVGV